MTATQPTITLNDGVELPALGFGVFQTPPDVTQGSVEEALRVGYRMVDTAASYLNEPEVGAAIAASGIARLELFVQTKVWVSDYGYDKALHAFDVSTRKLGIDYVDLYLLHQPLPQDFDATIDAYRALERLLEDGRVRAIGISNFIRLRDDATMVRPPRRARSGVLPRLLGCRVRTIVGRRRRPWNPDIRRGFHRFVRNPKYVAVTALIFGQAVGFPGSGARHSQRISSTT